MEHVCCGFTCDTDEEMKAHMNRHNCPKIAEFVFGPATVVEIDGKRIVAGHPEAVARHQVRTLMNRLDRAITALNDEGVPTANITDRYDALLAHLEEHNFIEPALHTIDRGEAK